MNQIKKDTIQNAGDWQQICSEVNKETRSILVDKVLLIISNRLLWVTQKVFDDLEAI